MARVEAWDSRALTMPICVDIWPGSSLDLYGSDLWRVPGVVPNILTFWSTVDGSATPIPERARATVQIVEATRDRMKLDNFRWWWWPERFGESVNGLGANLFGHVADRLDNGMKCLFTEIGQLEYRIRARDFADALSPLLKAAGLPWPDGICADYEGGVAVPVHDPASQVATWHDMLMADPRARSELIDGHQTYEQWSTKNLPGGVWPWEYDDGARDLTWVYTALRHSIIDNAMDNVLYQPFRAKNPNMLCGNWAIFAATPDRHVHNWRFKESPLGIGPTLKANFQMAPVYGNDTRDTKDMPLGHGYDTFGDQCGIFLPSPMPVLAAHVKDDLARAIHLGRVRYFLEGMARANPAKVGLCTAWNAPGIWQGPDVSSDPRKFPAWYQGATLDYGAHPEVPRAIRQMCIDHKAKCWNIFAQDATRTGLDAMAKGLAGA